MEPAMTAAIASPAPDGVESRHEVSAADLSWRSQSSFTRIYLTAVIAGGLSAVAALLPRSLPEPMLFSTLVVLTCVTSVWKVNLPIPLTSGATLSASYAANLMALLLLGPSHALLIGVAGAWTQCTYRV